MKSINESTLIPISLTIVLLGGVAWLTTLFNKVEANTQHLKQIEASQEKYARDMGEIKQSLSRIEGELKRIRH